MATQDSRIKIKRSTVSGTVPTVAPSDDHTQPTPAWTATDIYKGELFINQADNVVWSRGDDGVFCIGGTAKLTMTAADVKTLNSTPLTIVSAVSGYAIEVVSASVKIAFNTTAYAGSTNLELRHDGAALGILRSDCLGSTISNKMIFDDTVAPTTLNTQMLDNAALQVQAVGSDPTTGDSSVTVYVNYRLIPA
jgi:hypothetical protein